MVNEQIGMASPKGNGMHSQASSPGFSVQAQAHMTASVFFASIATVIPW